MVITCENCKKKFKIEASQIPIEGRNLKCGSCDHIWFYKIEEISPEPLPLNKDVFVSENKSIMFEEENEYIIDKKQPLSQSEIKNKEDKKTKDNQISLKNIGKENGGGKFFSYLIVIIISFVSLIVLIDTIKVPLINVFPGLEIILYSLFETLKDIKLFIIDLY